MPKTAPWLQSILEEHLQEVQLLWEMRTAALRDPEYVASDVAEIDERIEAHVDGLILAAQDAIPILEQGLGGDTASMVFSAAYVLLRMKEQTAADRVLGALSVAEGEQLTGLAEALAQGPIDLIAEKLKETYKSGPVGIAAIAAEAFAFRGWFSRDASRLKEFLSADPVIARSAWRTVSMVDGEGGQ